MGCCSRCTSCMFGSSLVPVHVVVVDLVVVVVEVVEVDVK